MCIRDSCQIDSLRKWLKITNREENFILVDFFCHGVPSYLLWNNYLASCQRKINPITQLAFRDKKHGWHAKTIMMKNDHKTIYNRMIQMDMFFCFYFSDVCLNSCCYNCKYKSDRSSADIRLGDFWGEKFKTDHQGVSAMLAYNQKGLEFVDILSNSCSVSRASPEQIFFGQMINPPRRPKIREKVLRDFGNQTHIKKIFTYAVLPKLLFIMIPRQLIIANPLTSSLVTLAKKIRARFNTN